MKQGTIAYLLQQQADLPVKVVITHIDDKAHGATLVSRWPFTADPGRLYTTEQQALQAALQQVKLKLKDSKYEQRRLRGKRKYIQEKLSAMKEGKPTFLNL